MHLLSHHGSLTPLHDSALRSASLNAFSFDTCYFLTHADQRAPHLCVRVWARGGRQKRGDTHLYLRPSLAEAAKPSPRTPHAPEGRSECPAPLLPRVVVGFAVFRFLLGTWVPHHVPILGVAGRRDLPHGERRRRKVSPQKR